MSMSDRGEEPDIVFTHHAESKFDILEQHGFSVNRETVIDALLDPDNVISAAKGRQIAQKRISERHVLCVVYREEAEALVVITFYPGRRKYYEGSV
jgi:hypothetical protein